MIFSQFTVLLGCVLLTLAEPMEKITMTGQQHGTSRMGVGAPMMMKSNSKRDTKMMMSEDGEGQGQGNMMVMKNQEQGRQGMVMGQGMGMKVMPKREATGKMMTGQTMMGSDQQQGMVMGQGMGMKMMPKREATEPIR